MAGNGLVEVPPVAEWSAQFRTALGGWMAQVKLVSGRQPSPQYPERIEVRASNGTLVLHVTSQERDTLALLQAELDRLLQIGHIGGRPYRFAYARLVSELKRGR